MAAGSAGASNSDGSVGVGGGGDVYGLVMKRTGLDLGFQELVAAPPSSFKRRQAMASIEHTLSMKFEAAH